MNGWKKPAAYLWRHLRRVRQWHLGVAFVVLLIITALALRQNNLTMIELRQQVVEADAALDGQAVDTKAQQLHSYVNQHMNTNTGQIALQHLYDQAVQQAVTAGISEVDSSAYQAASESCRSSAQQSGYQGYAACVASAVGISDQSLEEAELPNPALYYIAFLAPRLSFDLAGVSLVLTVVVFLTLLIRFLTEVTLGLLARKTVHF